MANINVADVLADPDFVDQITVISRASSVNSFGENTLVETPREAYGSVQPASGKTLSRLPEALRVANLRSFWIQGEIAVNGGTTYPDVIVFNGQRFLVQTVFDYTNWGTGWSEGTCVAEVPA